MTTTLTIQETGTTLTVASTLRMTASEAEALLDGVFEPVLGNPGTNGYVLSSTTAGVRSWVEQSGGGGGDVDDLTTTSGSSTNMLRVAAAGGLEYRTTAQVLADISAAPTASPTFTGTVTLPTTVASVIKPASDSTTALQLANAAGAAVLKVDTTNNRIGLGTTPTATFHFLRNGNTIYIDAESAFPGFTVIKSGGASFAAIADGTSGFKFGTYSANSHLLLMSGGTNTYSARLEAGKFYIGGDVTPTAYADLAASNTAAASLRIRSGTAPTTPNAGDLWFDGTNLKFYDGTTTRTLSWT